MHYKLNATIASPLENLPGLLFKEEENNTVVIEVQEYQPVVDQNHEDISASSLPKNIDSTLVHRCLEKLAEGKFCEEDVDSTTKRLSEYLLLAAEFDKRQHKKPSTVAKIIAMVALLWTAVWIPVMYSAIPLLLASVAALPIILGAVLLLPFTVIGTIVLAIVTPMAVWDIGSKLFSAWSSQKKEQQQLATQAQHLKSELTKLDNPINGATSTYDASATNGSSVSTPIPSAPPADKAFAWEKSASNGGGYTHASSSHWKLLPQQCTDTYIQDSQNNEVPRYVK